MRRAMWKRGLLCAMEFTNLTLRWDEGVNPLPRQGCPQLLVTCERGSRSWLSHAAVLFSRTGVRWSRSKSYPFQAVEFSRGGRGQCLWTSCIVHAATLILLWNLNALGFGTRTPERRLPLRITYHIEYLPVRSTPALRSNPLQTLRKQSPPPENAHAGNASKVLSYAIRPSSRRDTLVQSQAPPELRAPLPQTPSLAVLAPLRPKFATQLRAPTAPGRAVAAGPAAPEIRPAWTAQFVPLEKASLPVPVVAGISPRPSRSMGGDSRMEPMSAPEIWSNLPNGPTSGLVLLIADRSAARDSITVPASNVHGNSGSGNGSSSNAGSQTGAAGSGDASGDAMNGAGTTGGVAVPGMSIGGASAKSGQAALLGDYVPAVFPVIRPPHTRASELVISAGPGGGGGLGIYHILRGGKIYTVYLRMPRRHWVLQYCAIGVANAGAPRKYKHTVQLESPLLAPEPLERFDFIRPEIPDHNKHTEVVLHGKINEEGEISGLRIVQSVSAQVDLAAMSALAKWKFLPALRDKRPVAVEVLVGIPIRLQ